MVTEGNYSLNAECTVHCADDVLQNNILETDIILLTSVTPKNSIENVKEIQDLEINKM